MWGSGVRKPAGSRRETGVGSFWPLARARGRAGYPEKRSGAEVWGVRVGPQAPAACQRAEGFTAKWIATGLSGIPGEFWTSFMTPGGDPLLNAPLLYISSSIPGDPLIHPVKNSG